MSLASAEKAAKAFSTSLLVDLAYSIVPPPGYFVKKIPLWKFTVKGWDAEEFKNQVSNLFDELNDVT